VITILSVLCTFACDNLRWRSDNPALQPKRLKSKTDGYRAWLPAECEQFCARADADWQFAAILALLTAQRGQYQVAMAWTDYDGARLRVVQEKSGGRVKLWPPCHDALRAALDARHRRCGRLAPAGQDDLIANTCGMKGANWHSTRPGLACLSVAYCRVGSREPHLRLLPGQGEVGVRLGVELGHVITRWVAWSGLGTAQVLHPHPIVGIAVDGLQGLAEANALDDDGLGQHETGSSDAGDVLITPGQGLAITLDVEIEVHRWHAKLPREPRGQTRFSSTRPTVNSDDERKTIWAKLSL
jgi:hypothetical protein